MLPAVLLAAGWPISAQPALQDLVGAADWQQLLAGKRVSRTFEPGGGPRLLPAVPAAEAMRREVEGLHPTIGAELLILIDTPHADLSSPEGMLLLYNQMRSISGMKGLQYWSASRKRMRTLFAESYAIDSPERRQPLPDPLVRQVPASDRIFIYQKDLSFGENVHRVDYSFGGGSIVMTMRNLQPITYLLVPLVQPLDSLSTLLAIPQGSRVLLYGVSCSRTARLLGLERSKEDSLSNRMQAIAGWYADALSRGAAQAR